MTTMYQITPFLHLTKDMVFGWTVVNGDSVLVLDFATPSELKAVQNAVPKGLLFQEFHQYLQQRVATIQKQVEEAARQKAELNFQQHQQQLIQQARLDLEARALQERQKAMQRLEKSMQIWFGNLTPLRLYEVKNPSDEWVYARVVPKQNGYILLDRSGVVVAEETHLSAIVERIARRWW